jgi:hypothetical protein
MMYIPFRSETNKETLSQWLLHVKACTWVAVWLVTVGLVEKYLQYHSFIDDSQSVDS